MNIICIRDHYDDQYLFITFGKKYVAEFDEKHQPDCYWIVNDVSNYRPYKKYLFTTLKEIRQQKLKKIKCLK